MALFLGFCIEKQRRRISARHSHKSKSEKFPPPHEDSSVGFFVDHQQPENKNHSLVYVPGQAEKKNHSMIYIPRDMVPSTSVSRSGYTRPERKKVGADDHRVTSQATGKSSTSVSELFSSTHFSSTLAKKDLKDSKKLDQAQERNNCALNNHVSFTVK